VSEHTVVGRQNKNRARRRQRAYADARREITSRKRKVAFEGEDAYLLCCDSFWLLPSFLACWWDGAAVAEGTSGAADSAAPASWPGPVACAPPLPRPFGRRFFFA
jgi:hypothetical protein